MKAVEANIDGLIGPTHNYAGLSFGNIASEKHALSVSNPKQAALQGLHKMKFLHDLGIPQLVMPPQPRPDIGALKSKGFNGIADASKEVLHQVYSASSMWVANAATISPSADTQDGKVHITPANLTSYFHRSIETSITASYLKQIFCGEHFVHHEPLLASAAYSDEGAANHMRLSREYGEKGIEIFVYGGATQKYPARQSRKASEEIARLHGLHSNKILFLEQGSEAIDSGVFHNDVIAMSNCNLLIHHEKAYKEDQIKLSNDFVVVSITERELPIVDAVTSYFFNSQLVSLPEEGMAIIAPKECEENTKAKACFDKLINKGIIKKVYYLDVRESMKNGGGPACLRLRVVLTEQERNAVHSQVWLSDMLYNSLCKWIEKHYRDRITPDDLRDPLLAKESSEALDVLSDIIKIKLAAA